MGLFHGPAYAYCLVDQARRSRPYIIVHVHLFYESVAKWKIHDNIVTSDQLYKLWLSVGESNART
jgi:hypothetical protein